MPHKGVHEFTPSKRGRILALKDEGYTYRAIADQVGGCTASAAHKTVKRDENYHTRKSLPRSGRPPAITDRTRRVALRELRNNRFANFGIIADHIGSLTKRQVKDIAHAAGYNRRVARRKPFLSKAAVTKRKQWALDNKEKDWKYVIWTDETKIETGERPGRKRVTRRPGEEFLPENIAPTFRSGRQSIMVWAAITHNHKGPIVRLDLVPEITTGKGKKKGGGLNGQRYVDQILEGPLKQFSMEVERGSEYFFEIVEDGAPSHRSVVANRARTELGITSLTHPPSSPDLNPIEPLWLLLKNKVADIPGSANSLDALWSAVQCAWGDITLEDIRKHTGKMDDRVEAVKKAEGWHTRF